MGLWKKKRPESANDAPTATFLWSSNMQLRVAAPEGDGWQRLEARPTDQGLLAGFKCLHGSPPDALALDAHVYRLTPAQLPTLSELAERDWHQHFEQQMLSTISALSCTKVAHHTVAGGFTEDGYEIHVKGQLREPAQAIEVIQRHVPIGDRLLIVSAAASKEQHERFAKLIGSWLAHAMVGD